MGADSWWSLLPGATSPADLGITRGPQARLPVLNRLSQVRGTWATQPLDYATLLRATRVTARQLDGYLDTLIAAKLIRVVGEPPNVPYAYLRE